MTVLALQCQFCGEHTRPRPVEETHQAVGLYLAHLVESHWDMLELARRQRLATGIPLTHDAWKRL